MKKLFLIVILTALGCNSAELVDNWKNPDIVIFNANKVLLVGMTHKEDARVEFETKLKKEFDDRGIEAMRSIDLFDVDFTRSARTEKELDKVESQLLEKDFDAILITKIIGTESRESFRKTAADLYNYHGGFKEDYRQHQDVYYDSDYYEKYTVYHAETSLYCLCEGKDRSLIWRGNIDILDPEDMNKTIDDYVKLVVMAMEEQDLIFRKKKKDEVSGL
ncbi:MAG: hypothetical protein MUO53_02790 [Maribacter sp.]|nr:hypothetical protein [Maribacter sp.]